jgi:hypothetical protein
MKARIVTALIAVLGVGSLANAAWMLASPAGWYGGIEGVADTGPLNVHFVRDIGCAFATVGLALVWAALRPALRAPLVAVAGLFYGAHALLHVHDVLRGLLGFEHWLEDFPGVFLPALLLAWIAFESRSRPARVAQG